MARVAFVTGGAGGIGMAICQRLADAGHRVASSYIPPEKEHAMKWQEESKASGRDYYLVQGNVASFEDSAQMVDQVEKALTGHGFTVKRVRNPDHEQCLGGVRLDRSRPHSAWILGRPPMFNQTFDSSVR